MLITAQRCEVGTFRVHLIRKKYHLCLKLYSDQHPALATSLPGKEANTLSGSVMWGEEADLDASAKGIEFWSTSPYLT